MKKVADGTVNFETGFAQTLSRLKVSPTLRINPCTPLYHFQ
jgi:hypothetical protein